jgi:hypothetical protein
VAPQGDQGQNTEAHKRYSRQKGQGDATGVGRFGDTLAEALADGLADGLAEALAEGVVISPPPDTVTLAVI